MGDRTLIGLEGNSSIDLDWKNNRYKVVVDGVEVASDGDTYCPVGKDRIAFYSKTEKRLTAPLPAGWTRDTIAAITWSSSLSEFESLPLKVHDGKVSVKIPPERPVLVVPAQRGVPAGLAMNHEAVE